MKGERVDVPLLDKVPSWPSPISMPFRSADGQEIVVVTIMAPISASDDLLVDIEAYASEPITPRRKLSNVGETGLDYAVKQARTSRASSAQDVSVTPISRTKTKSWIPVDLDFAVRRHDAGQVEEVDIYEDPFSDYSEHVSPLHEVDAELEDSPTDPDLHEDESLQRRQSRRRTLAPTTAVKSEYSQESWAGPSPTAPSIPKLNIMKQVGVDRAGPSSHVNEANAAPQQPETYFRRRSRVVNQPEPPATATAPDIPHPVNEASRSGGPERLLGLWYCVEPFVELAFLLVAAVIVNISVHSFGSNLSIVATATAESFGNASLAGVEKGDVKIGCTALCTNNGTDK